MKKQIISLLLIAVMVAMLLPTVAFADYYGTQWVYTDNGKSLNVRSTPSTGNNIIGSLKYGAEVTVVEMYSNGWAQILWAQNAYGEFGVAYVQRRFQVNHKPTSQPAQSSTAPCLWRHGRHGGFGQGVFRDERRIQNGQAGRQTVYWCTPVLPGLPAG